MEPYQSWNLAFIPSLIYYSQIQGLKPVCTIGGYKNMQNVILIQ